MARSSRASWNSGTETLNFASSLSQPGVVEMEVGTGINERVGALVEVDVVCPPSFGCPTIQSKTTTASARDACLPK